MVTEDSTPGPGTDTAGRSQTPTRRDVISQATAAVGLGVTATSLTASARTQNGGNGQGQGQGKGQDEQPNGKAKRLRGKKRKNAIAAAMSDPRTKQIRQALIHRRDMHPVPGKGKVAKSITDDGREWRTVIIPFDDKGGPPGNKNFKDQTYIAWSDNEAYDVQVAGYDAVHKSPAGQPAYWVTTEFHVERGEIVTEKHRTKNFLGCNDVDWGCVCLIAGAYAGMIGACGTCATTLIPWACAGCIGMVLTSTGTTLKCKWCND